MSHSPPASSSSGLARRRNRLRQAVVGAALGVILLAKPAAWPGRPASASEPQPTVGLSEPARQVLAWIQRSGDNQGASFVIIDKHVAHLWVFDAASRVLADTPVLLGLAVGDHTVPGIGDRPLRDIKPFERTTPAGRFALKAGRNSEGEDVLWVDYDAAVSLHRVRPGQPGDRRLQRLATPSVDDNRISYGCINVPITFYNRYVNPRFARHGGYAYLLPEQRRLAEVFPGTAPAGEPAGR